MGLQYCNGTAVTGASKARGYETSRSTVAKRPLDASCLSVVSFDIPTAQVFLLLVPAASDLGY